MTRLLLCCSAIVLSARWDGYSIRWVSNVHLVGECRPF